MMYGSIDRGDIDLGGLDSFGARMAVARAVGGRAVKKDGRWVVTGGVSAGPLDHPVVLRHLGHALEPDPTMPVYFEPDSSGTVPAGLAEAMAEAEAAECGAVSDSGPAAAYEPGPLVLAYLARLVCPLKLDYVAALCNELAGGGPAAVPDGMGPELAAKTRARFLSLARRDGAAL